MLTAVDGTFRRVLVFSIASILSILSGCVEAPLTDGGVDVSDPDTLPSGTDEDDDVVVDPPVPPASVNSPPAANAGEDRTVTEGQWLRLDGSGSADPDGEPLTYAWTVVGGPEFELDGSESAQPSFIAPQVSADTTLRITLTVGDGEQTDSDDVEVLVLAVVESAGTGPVADAGSDQTVDGGSVVTLDGSGSEGEGGEALTFDWVQVSGPPVVLSGASSPMATFTAPSGLSIETALTFELEVEQRDLLAVDEVSVTVRAGVIAPPPGGGTPPPPPPPPPPTDNCPNDPTKTQPGICGCGVPDADGDGDGTMNCVDGCPIDPDKTAAGVCGCGVPDTDTDGDGTRNCVDGCPNDPAKVSAGLCGCGVAETDRDGDSTPDCLDGCPDDPSATDPADCPDPTASRDTDWNLYMLRLVNRARRDPSGEAARIGSSVVDNSAPVQPLAYDLLVGDTANNHNDWMHDNFGGIPSGRTPDTFSHFETMDGLSTGTPATGTLGYTGVNVGQRFTYAGFTWGTYGENIQTNYASFDLPVHQARIDASHRGWWESAGHRSNMLYASFTAFGFHIESRAFVPPRGGLNAPFDNLLFATQNFGRPLNSPRTYILALVYRDLDNNGVWTPRPVGDSLREGLAGVDFEVYAANTATLVTSGVTLGNGGLSVRAADGTYDLVLNDPSFSGGQFVVQDVVVAGSNVDVGDFRLAP